LRLDDGDVDASRERKNEHYSCRENLYVRQKLLHARIISLNMGYHAYSPLRRYRETGKEP